MATMFNYRIDGRRAAAAARSRGFTLVELMVVLVIVAVLAAIAVPSYLTAIRKGRRSDAVAATVAIENAQERWRANHPNYATDLTSAPAAGLGQAATSPKGYYTMALNPNLPAAANPGKYTILANAVAGMGQDKDGACANLSVTVINGNAVNAPAECWSQ
jgi:type IV pilus assembly protein PilE